MKTGHNEQLEDSQKPADPFCSPDDIWLKQNTNNSKSKKVAFNQSNCVLLSADFYLSWKTNRLYCEQLSSSLRGVVLGLYLKAFKIWKSLQWLSERVSLCVHYDFSISSQLVLKWKFRRKIKTSLTTLQSSSGKLYRRAMISHRL